MLDADEIALLEDREVLEAEVVEHLREVAGLGPVRFMVGRAVRVISGENWDRFEGGKAES